jgi:O-antigen biosynthesis protein
MKEPYIRSKVSFIQRIFDFISIKRHEMIKDGSESFWVYDHLVRQPLIELHNGNSARAVMLFRYGYDMYFRQGFKVDHYLDWIYQHEPMPAELENQRTVAAGFQHQPLISIITPVYRPPVQVLAYMLESVGKQSYPNWEHCIVNADPGDKATAQKLAQHARKDPRVKVKTLEKNMGIAENSNEAIKMAQGEWIAFLDHDDQIAPFALYEVVKLINQTPDADAIFSDEDKISSADQRRFSPFFKPDFNLDYLRSLNYMTHFFVLRKSLGDSIGWLNREYDGSQDYDLALKVSEKTKHIFRIPQILYHWKVTEGSTAVSSENKLYAVDAGELALKAHLGRSEPAGKVTPDIFPYIVRYEIKGTPKISMVIPNRDNAATLKRLMDSIFNKSTYSNFEILIVENHSQEKETFDYYAEITHKPEVRILQWEKEFNFSLVNNFAVEKALGEVILLLNNDLEVISEDWLERMLEHALRSEIGAVGAKLFYPNNTIQHAGVIVGMFGVAGHSQKLFPGDSAGYYNRLVTVQDYSAVTAACMMLRREVYHEVGGLDPAFKIEFGDVDFCLRILRQGYRNLWTPFAQLYHHESLTRGGYDTDEKRELNLKEVALFKEHWSAFLAHCDPSYNPNLTHTREDFHFHDYQQLYVTEN